MADLILNRVRHDDRATQGALYRAGPSFLCYTLERGPGDGQNKRYTDRIPAGEYVLQLRDDLGWAERLGRPVVEITGVPNRSLILFHPANFWHELEGCVAPGQSEFTDENGALAVGRSRAAFEAIEPVIVPIAQRGGTILITDEAS